MNLALTSWLFLEDKSSEEKQYNEKERKFPYKVL